MSIMALIIEDNERRTLQIDISGQRRWIKEERLAAMKAAPLLLGWVVR